jgi:hypothetical protein
MVFFHLSGLCVGYHALLVAMSWPVCGIAPEQILVNPFSLWFYIEFRRLWPPEDIVLC